MKHIFTLMVLVSLFLSGCANISPFSPKHRLDNKGKIDDMVTAQDSIVKEIGKLHSEIQGNNNKAQGVSGNRNDANTGVQILTGDGALIVLLALGTVAMILVFVYRSRAIKSEKATEILTEQIALTNNPELENNVVLAARNTIAENNIYHSLISKKRKFG